MVSLTGSQCIARVGLALAWAALLQNVAASPILTPNVWTPINPPQLTWSGVQGSGTSFSQGLAIDPETDGATWTAQPNAGLFSCGPFEMAVDKTNKIIYSSTWAAGLLALKAPGCACIDATIPGKIEAVKKPSIHNAVSLVDSRYGLAGNAGVSIRAMVFYNVKGEVIGRAGTGSIGRSSAENDRVGRQMVVVRMQ